MLFSIITINFNNDDGLQRTIESVLNQTFTSYEYIIVDGGSTDNSKERLKKIEQINVTIISEKDTGIYDAMNKGLELSKGEFVIFLNSGDYFASKLVLSEISNLISKSKDPYDFIYGNAYEFSPKTNKTFFKKARSHNKIWYGMFAHHQSMLYSRKIIENNNLRYDLAYRLSSDWDFTIRFIKYCNVILKIETPISVFEQGGFSDKYIIGLNEQFKIRRNSLKFPVVFCIFLYLFQLLMNLIRKTMPFIYNIFRLKNMENIKIQKS